MYCVDCAFTSRLPVMSILHFLLYIFSCLPLFHGLSILGLRQGTSGLLKIQSHDAPTILIRSEPSYVHTLLIINSLAFTSRIPSSNVAYLINRLTTYPSYSKEIGDPLIVLRDFEGLFAVFFFHLYYLGILLCLWALFPCQSLGRVRCDTLAHSKLVSHDLFLLSRSIL